MASHSAQEEIIFETLHYDRAAGVRMLFDAYYTPLCLFALQMTDDFDASEDIVQTFFVTLLEKGVNLQECRNLRAYIFTAIRNNTLSYMRKNHAANMISFDDAIISDQTIDSFVEIEEHQDELKIREQQLYHTLEMLSANEREALERVVVNEASYKDAAREMGISVNTLKTYLRRAMRKLREKNLSVMLFF